MKKIKLLLVILSTIIIFPINIYAHPGRTDSNGGHYDRSTGEYHYHDGRYKGQSSSSSNKNKIEENDNDKLWHKLENSSQNKISKNYNFNNTDEHHKNTENKSIDEKWILILLFIGLIFLLTHNPFKKDKEN